MNWGYRMIRKEIILLIDERKITGAMFAYSFLCKRKLWFFANQITMEQESELVEIGKYIDENSYDREEKHVFLDDSINLDYMKNGVVYEIKKSTKEKKNAELQVKYYLYTLWKLGQKKPIGILKVPKEHYEEEIGLELEDIDMIEKQLVTIRKIISSYHAPQLEEKKECKYCAYYEMCHI